MADAYAQYISKITKGGVEFTETDPSQVLYTDVLPDLTNLTADLLSEIYSFEYFNGTIAQLIAITDYNGHLQTQTAKFLAKYPLDEKLESKIYTRNLLLRSVHNFLLPYDVTVFSFYTDAFRAIATNEMLATIFKYLNDTDVMKYSLRLNRFYIVDFFINLGDRIEKITKELEKLEKALAKLAKSIGKPITLTETAKLLAQIKLEYKNPENVRRLLRQYDKKLQRRVQWCESCAKQLLDKIEQLKKNSQDSLHDYLNLYKAVDQGLCVYSSVINNEIQEHLNVIKKIIGENPLFAAAFLVMLVLTPFGISVLGILSGGAKGAKNLTKSLKDFKLFMTSFETALKVNPALGPTKSIYDFLNRTTTNVNAVASISAYVYNSAALLYNLITKATNTNQPQDYISLFCNATTRLIDLLLFLVVSTPDTSKQTSPTPSATTAVTSGKTKVERPTKVEETKTVSGTYSTSTEVEKKSEVAIDNSKVVDTERFFVEKTEKEKATEEEKALEEVKSEESKKESVVEPTVSKPQKMLFMELTDEVILPTQNKDLDAYVKKIRFKLVDSFGNEIASTPADNITVMTDAEFLQNSFKITGNEIEITNSGLTKSGTYQLDFVNEKGEKLGELQVVIKPLQRILKSKEIKVVKYNLFSVKLQVEDGNGNPSDGELLVTVNESFEEKINLKNGQAEFLISPRSLALWSLKVRLNPSIDEIEYREQVKTIELIDDILYAGRLNARTVKQITKISHRDDNTLQPVISPTGNYVCYFAFEDDEAKLIMYNTNTEESWDILASTSGRRNTGIKQETVWNYFWMPSKDILIYTPSINDVFEIDAYIPDKKRRKTLYRTESGNSLEVSVDVKGKLALWVVSGKLMCADITNDDDISFTNPRDLFQDETGTIIQPALSPDGRYVVYIVGNNLRCYDLKTNKSLQLTSTLLSKLLPTWSPNGKYVLYYEKNNDRYRLRLLDFETVGEETNAESKLLYDNVAIDFGKPVWLSNTELAFIPLNDTITSGGTMKFAVYNITNDSISYVIFEDRNATTCTYPTVTGQLKDEEYKILIAYGAFNTEFYKEQIYIGELE